MNKITKIDATKLAQGIKEILLEQNDPDAKMSISDFEAQIMLSKNVSKKDAEKVTEAIINTGIIRWEIFSNHFVL